MQRKSLTLSLAAAILALLAGNVAAADKTATPQPKATETAKTTPTAIATPTLNSTPAAKASPTVVSTPKADAKAGAAAPLSKTAEPKADEAKEGVHHKSAVLASTLAFIPGFAIHGVGHMYAGSWVKGTGLFLLGSGGAAIAAYEAVHGYDDIQSMVNDAKDGSIPTDLSPALSKVGIILVGTAAFLFTWWDDMAGAPIAVDRYNKRADEAAPHAELNVLPTNGGAQLVYTAKF